MWARGQEEGEEAAKRIVLRVASRKTHKVKWQPDKSLAKGKEGVDVCRAGWCAGGGVSKGKTRTKTRGEWAATREQSKEGEAHEMKARRDDDAVIGPLNRNKMRRLACARLKMPMRFRVAHARMPRSGHGAEKREREARHGDRYTTGTRFYLHSPRERIRNGNRSARHPSPSALLSFPLPSHEMM